MNANIKRNIYILSLCNGLSITTGVVNGTVSALACYAVTGDKSLVTIPIALQFLGSMFFTVPASMLMKHLGRQAGFRTGAVIGISGGLMGFLAIAHGNFRMLCAGAFLSGISVAFAFYYRFAVADMSDENYRSKAISYVMAGGVAAAFLGTTVANFTREAVAGKVYAGSFLAIAALHSLSFLLICFVNIPKPTELEAHHSGRRLRDIVRQPVFAAAVLISMLGYGLMIFLMSATPLSMQDHRHMFHDISFVFQWHVLGMFAPSFFTGYLINRFGSFAVLMCGVAFNALCVTVNLFGTSLWHYWVALIFLGIGWNFCFISGTTLLTRTYTVSERAKTQAANDFLVFFTVTAVTLSSGFLYNRYGWKPINIGCLPVIGLLFVLIFKARDVLKN